MTRIKSVEDHKLAAMYESVRRQLRSAKYHEHGSKPLAFWVLPKDRRLPLALLGYSLKGLLAHSFEELSDTAGVGKKKLYSLVKLLHRATKEEPREVTPLVDEPASMKKGKRIVQAEAGRFNAAVVSELLWEQWRTTVRRCGLEEEPLGRFSPSLYRLPTVIWRTPLSEYMDLTIDEMRRLKTHGEKRVRAILEVFHGIHELLGRVGESGYLHADVRPKFTMPMERWINRVLRASRPPRPSDIQRYVVGPILAQLRIDAGPEVVRLVEERLGVRRTRQSVQQQANRMRVTRARVYQLLDTCGEILSVRWPDGETLMERLLQKLSTIPKGKAQTDRLRALTALVYPSLAERSATAKAGP